MAKKKIEESEEEELSDLDDDISELEDEDIVLPKIEKEDPEKEEEVAETPAVEFEAEDEDLDLLTDEQPELLVKDYKFIKPDIVKGVNEFDYELIMEGQSHGFCNILVKHLLKIEGVNIAAYKITNIDNPKIFLRIQEGYKVKDIIFKGIAALQDEVSSVEKVFAKLM
jgi:DNA-directed RNA polymerase subunit L